MSDEEPAVLLEAAHDLDSHVLAGEVDLVETVDGRLHIDQNGVNVCDHVADDGVGLREASRYCRLRSLRGYRAKTCIDREAESDDALCCGVGEVASVRHDRVEQLVDANEIRAADVPVRLLAVDGERLKSEDNGRKELGGRCGHRGVAGGGRNGLGLAHDFSSDKRESLPDEDNATHSETFRKQAEARLIPRDYAGFWLGEAILRFMTVAATASVIALKGRVPSLADGAFVADGARIVGDVTLKPGSSIWYNAVLRADSAAIVVGTDSNVQDNVSVHVDSVHPALIGDRVSIGHNAVVHGCTIGDGSLIGMGAVVLSGAVIGKGCLVAGGAVILGGTEIPDGSLVAGVPAKVRRALTEEEKQGLIANAEIYLDHRVTHALASGSR